jgi:hypothetical protein
MLLMSQSRLAVITLLISLAVLLAAGSLADRVSQRLRLIAAGVLAALSLVILALDPGMSGRTTMLRVSVADFLEDGVPISTASPSVSHSLFLESLLDYGPALGVLLALFLGLITWRATSLLRSTKGWSLALLIAVFTYPAINYNQGPRYFTLPTLVLLLAVATFRRLQIEEPPGTRRVVTLPVT